MPVYMSVNLTSYLPCSSKGQRFGERGYQAAFHCDDVTSAPQTRRPEITWGMLKITWGCHAMNHTIFNQQHDLFMKKLTSGNVCRRKKKKMRSASLSTTLLPSSFEENVHQTAVWDVTNQEPAFG